MRAPVEYLAMASWKEAAWKTCWIEFSDKGIQQDLGERWSLMVLMTALRMWQLGRSGQASLEYVGGRWCCLLYYCRWFGVCGARIIHTLLIDLMNNHSWRVRLKMVLGTAEWVVTRIYMYLYLSHTNFNTHSDTEPPGYSRQRCLHTDLSIALALSRQLGRRTTENQIFWYLARCFGVV